MFIRWIESPPEWLVDLIIRAGHTAWQTFLAAWPTGTVLTDWGTWKMAGIAAVTAFIAALLSSVKTYLLARP